MAVEATHPNFFPTQMCESNAYISNINNIDMISGDPFNTSISGVTYNLSSTQRKRPRDNNTKNNLPQDSSLFGEEILLRMQQQQMEIDHIISLHTKKIRLEVEERQKQQARMLVSGVLKTLNEKDEQIHKMAKINSFLQEKVKTLSGENQFWRDIAQTNEATAISLRTNLEQVLAHVSLSSLTGAVAEEVESCCGSSSGGADNDEEEVEKRTLANNMCRKCEERESCVLLLPCRHLCLCTSCGSTLLKSCPNCNSVINTTVHVNMS